MLQRCGQRGLQRSKCPVRLADGLQYHRLAVVVQILVKQHRMVLLLLCLNLIPVCKAVQTLRRIKIGDVQIKIGRIKLLVDLLVEQCGNGCFHDNTLRSAAAPPLHN